MLTWLVSLTASSLTFALADVLCDVVINETGEGGTPKVASAVDEEEDVHDDAQRRDGMLVLRQPHRPAHDRRPRRAPLW